LAAQNAQIVEMAGKGAFVLGYSRETPVTSGAMNGPAASATNQPNELV